MKKIVLKDATLQIDQNSILIEREGGFLTLSNTSSFAGFKNVQNILNCSLAPEDLSVAENEEENQNFISRLMEEKRVKEPAAVILSPAYTNKIETITINEVTAVLTAGYLDDGSIATNIIILINRDLDKQSLLKLFTASMGAKLSALYDLDVINPSNTTAQLALRDNLLLACKGPEEPEEPENKENSDLIELQVLVQESVREGLTNLLKNLGYPKTIQDYIEGTGVNIEDLVAVGMELLVGVEKSEELYTQLHEQIMKALEDINVIALIMAGIRLEEDLGRHRVRGVNVDDDPAYLYSDEVLGIAIANQIAGTKAIFNFKRYDEEKPGILSTLGPVLDDVFAGLVAGCMSKMFEE